MRERNNLKGLIKAREYSAGKVMKSVTHIKPIYFIAHGTINGIKKVHYNKMIKNQHTSTGLPNLEITEDPEEWKARLKKFDIIVDLKDYNY